MFTVTKNGKPLDKSLYTIDEKTRTFSSTEDELNIETDEDGWKFRTDSCCTFRTSYGCTFTTGYYCTFTTGSDCTFDTGSDCTFTTGPGCTFDTYSYCTFKTGEECVCVRRDVYEVIEIPEGKRIKLNASEVKGFVYLEEEKTIEIEGKKFTVSQLKDFIAKAE